MTHSTLNPHVLVLDSGVGALSVIAEIRRQLPSLSLTYASDNGYFPYGTKPEAALVDRVHEVLARLIDQYCPDIVVVACNTASTVALPKIRSAFTLPIVGVVPAIKPAAQQSKTRTFGVVATPGTINRQYTTDLINQFAADCEVIKLGSGELVALAEAKLCGEPIDQQAVGDALAPMLDDPRLPRMDTVVLACTHFPLLKAELIPWFAPTVQWLDSGAAIARRVAHLLSEAGLGLASGDETRYRCVFTADTDGARRLRGHLNAYVPGEVEYLRQ